MLVLRGGRVAGSTGGRTDCTRLAVLGRTGQVEISLGEDGASRPYVALTLEKEEVGYAALMDAEVFFAIAERQTAAEESDRILVLDVEERYFFHRTPAGIRVDAVDSLDPAAHPSLYLMLSTQRAGEAVTSFFSAGNQSEGGAIPPGRPSCPPPATKTDASPWGCPGTTMRSSAPIRPRRFKWCCAA